MSRLDFLGLDAERDDGRLRDADRETRDVRDTFETRDVLEASEERRASFFRFFFRLPEAKIVADSIGG